MFCLYLLSWVALDRCAWNDLPPSVSVVLDRYSRCLYVGNSQVGSCVGVTVDLSPSHGFLFFYFDLRYFRNLFSLNSLASIGDHFHHFFPPKILRPRFLLGTIFNPTCKFYSKIKHFTHTKSNLQITNGKNRTKLSELTSSTKHSLDITSRAFFASTKTAAFTPSARGT